MGTRERRKPKRNFVEKLVRQKIASGEWKPGVQLPKRKELQEDLDVSMVTLQRAFDNLIEEGFVDATRNVGTFVSEHPPHISQFALAIPFDPDLDSGRWSNFWDALVAEAEVVEQNYPYAINPYYGVGKHPNVEGYRKLVKRTQEHRIAGIIFATSPHLVTGTPLTEEPGIPHAAIMSGGPSSEIAAVDCPAESFYRRALDHLADSGCETVGILAARQLPVDEASLHRWMDQRGLRSRPEWVHFLSPWLDDGNGRVARLLMSHSDDRPDGVIIADENMVPACTRGIAATDIDIPHEVTIVGHTNFPHPTESHFPIERIGFDTRHILGECVERILEQRRGEEPRPLTRVEAVAKEELTEVQLPITR